MSVGFNRLKKFRILDFSRVEAVPTESGRPPAVDALVKRLVWRRRGRRDRRRLHRGGGRLGAFEPAPVPGAVRFSPLAANEVLKTVHPSRLQAVQEIVLAVVLRTPLVPALEKREERETDQRHCRETCDPDHVFLGRAHQQMVPQVHADDRKHGENGVAHDQYRLPHFLTSAALPPGMGGKKGCLSYILSNPLQRSSV